MSYVEFMLQIFVEALRKMTSLLCGDTEDTSSASNPLKTVYKGQKR